LKPDNIFLVRGAEGDRVRILDFGSVKLQLETGPKLTAFGTTLGSPYYMSPEQAMGRPDVDNRSDVFALGAIVYETLSGKVAFEGETVAEILMKILSQSPVPLSVQRPGLPASLDEVIDRALAKDKTKRHSSALAFVGDLLHALGLRASEEPATREEIEEWCKRPLKEIEEALAKATPRQARPYSAQATQAEPSGQKQEERETLVLSSPSNRSFRSVWLWAGIAALCLLGLAGVWLFGR
ncbi:MAG: serine/threonine protein kinase, partial [Sandaracinaceae bacterium]|nr:serine/threonine protein kinase [Sandaracinaceae bacterium]